MPRYLVIVGPERTVVEAPTKKEASIRAARTYSREFVRFHPYMWVAEIVDSPAHFKTVEAMQLAGFPAPGPDSGLTEPIGVG
jgi:hypothetical protein